MGKRRAGKGKAKADLMKEIMQMRKELEEEKKSKEKSDRGDKANSKELGREGVGVKGDRKDKDSQESSRSKKSIAVATGDNRNNVNSGNSKQKESLAKKTNLREEKIKEATQKEEGIIGEDSAGDEASEYSKEGRVMRDSLSRWIRRDIIGQDLLCELNNLAKPAWIQRLHPIVASELHCALSAGGVEVTTDENAHAALLELFEYDDESENRSERQAKEGAKGSSSKKIE